MARAAQWQCWSFPWRTEQVLSALPKSLESAGKSGCGCACPEPAQERVSDAGRPRSDQVTGREHARGAPNPALSGDGQARLLEHLATARSQIDPEE
jgi:hypothetical protein